MIKHTAVIGFPLAHTLSPALHNAVYEQVGIDACMETAPDEDIKRLVQLIREKPISLTAVTIPHKETIIEYLDEVDTVAREIGAVNTVINRGGKLYGYNTDVVGISIALQGVEIKGKNVIVLGAGGAARAVAYYIAKQGGNLYYYNRTQEKAEQLQKEFGGMVITESDIPKIIADVIVNTTPLGLFPNVDTSPLENYTFNSKQAVFDMVYNPRETKLLQTAKAAGATTISGIEMFIGQALEQVRLWTGETFPIEEARKII